MMAIFDLTAKATALCAMQFNGQYGCSICLHLDKRLQNKTQIYPPDASYFERTHAGVVSDAAKAEASHRPVMGVYGTSPLTSMINLVDFHSW